MKSSVNEVWIKSAFYVFNTVFDGEYDRKIKKIKKFPQPGFEPTTLKKAVTFKKRYKNRVIKNE